MVIQLIEEVPAVCQNKECENFLAFELVDVTLVKDKPDDEGGYAFVLCEYCSEPIKIP